MVDRVQECRSVVDLLRRAGTNGPKVMLVEGEPGIGRTRLLTEAARTAIGEGFAVASGEFPELGQPVEMGPLLSALGEATIADLAPPGGLDRRMRLVDGLRTALETRARSRPLLVLLDDLQWADPATISVLRTLPARLVSYPVCWILSRCTVHGGNKADRLFALLEEDGAVLVRLPPLGAEDVTGLVVDTLGARPDSDLRALAERAGGNPLLLVELLKGLHDEGGVAIVRGRARLVSPRLPQRIHALVRHRLEALDPTTRQLLEVMAVLGPAFTPGDAADLLGMTPAEQLPPLEAALAAGFLTVREDDLAFRHELVRQAVVGAIPAPVRQALHVQIGRTLLGRGDRVTDAAAHLMGGAGPGDPPALADLDQAAAKVFASAPPVAADLAGRALALTDPADPLWFPRTLSAANALVAAGRPAEAAELADTALHHRTPGPATAELLTVLSFALLLMGQVARASATAMAALGVPDLPDELRDRAELALLQAEAEQAGNTGVRERARAIVAAGEPHGRAVTTGALTVLALSSWDEGDLAGALEFAHAAVRQAAGGPPDARRLHPGMVLAMLLVDVRSADEGRQAMAVATREAESPGQAGWEAESAILRSRLHLAEGRLSEAILDARSGLEAADAVGAHLLAASARSALSVAALRSGDLETAARHLHGDRADPARPGSSFTADRMDLIEAQVTEAREGPRAAMAALTGLYEGLPEHNWTLLGDPTTPAWLVRTALAAGERDRAEHVVAATDRLARINSDFPSVGTAAMHAHGLLHHDPRALRHAAAAHTDPWARASATEDLGVLLCEEGGDRRQAIQRFDEALAGYLATEAARDAARVRGRLRRLGERRRHWKRSDRPTTGWASLTGTERRISEFVAQGLTNRRIAEQMFISAHTVAFHLRQVFRKLGIGSRVELARLVLEHAEDQTMPGNEDPPSVDPRGPRPRRPMTDAGSLETLDLMSRHSPQ
jgi:DNA-binding CsgD family transcriptional regulator